MQITRPQARRIYQATFGYRDDKLHDIWISEQWLVYLTIYNVVYIIDREGGYLVRAKKDGRILSSYGPNDFLSEIDLVKR